MSKSLQKVPKHILKLSTQEKRNFLDSFENIFSDIDGVLWHALSPIQNTEKGFKLLKNAGKNVTFITNNSVVSLEKYLKKFEMLNMNIDENSIYHPAKSIVKYLNNINFKGSIYVIGSKFLMETLNLAGFEVIDSPHQFFDNLKAFEEKLFDHKPAKAVVIDTDINLSYFKLLRAEIYLNNVECLFISGATDILVPITKNLTVHGPGYYLKILMESTKRKPIALGKPGAELAELLKKDFKITNPKQALMIGDLLEQDMAFGNVCGFQTLAVLSGGTKLQDLLNETNPDYIPDYYADSMVDFIEFFEDIK